MESQTQETSVTETEKTTGTEEGEVQGVEKAAAETTSTTEAEVKDKGELTEEEKHAENVAKTKLSTDEKVQKKIDKITRQAKLEAENAYLRGKAETLETFLSKSGAAKEEPKKEDPGLVRPKMRDFSDEDEYYAAEEKYFKDFKAAAVAEAREAARQEREQEARKIPQNTAAEIFKKNRKEFVKRGSKEFEDFEEMITDRDLNITTVMASKLFKLEHGTSVAGYLHEHPEESVRIASMIDLVDQVDAVAELHDKIKAAKTARETNAPKPLKTLKGGGEIVHTEEDKMSDKEWNEYRKKKKISSA